MQTKNKWFLAAPIAAIFSILLSSFSPKPGGDVCEIYVNNKLVYQKHVASDDKSLQTLTWKQANSNDQVDIYFSHCGVPGKKRSIAIKDAQNTVLKQLNFADAKGGNNKSMSFKVRDILGTGKNNSTIYLYYSSAELPKGKLLTAIKQS